MSTTIDFGIDLGTTNSCVARWENGDIRTFQTNDQMSVTPSAVYINRVGHRVVGLPALHALRTDPESVATEFKRWMGQKDRHTFPAAKLSLSAEELSAEILKSLRKDVLRQTGIDMTTAVITVPAAFGTPQCEATARAASLAGIVEAPLLQEPIAAAIGYGVGPDKANQRWLVFDLGGGTLDIAVVSTRDGRLSVLEHTGNNLRGGKDVDRLIVDKLLLPAIEKQFGITAMRAQGKLTPLYQKLRAEAERAKIALSSESSLSVLLNNLGGDDHGKPIELDVEVTRTQVESLMEPMVAECVTLAKAALTAARIGGADLDRILLVGGPTRTPMIRSRLAAELGAPVDFSTDPMTVVARGAALYATTLQREVHTVVSSALPRIAVTLAYEPVCAELTCPIAGRVSIATPGLEIKFDARESSWTSDWLALKSDFFETNLQLKADAISTFGVYLRDARGHPLDIEVTEFKVRHGLVPSEPLLPHTLSVELLDAKGNPSLDVVFPRGTPLPVTKTVKYLTARALDPTREISDINVKLWEGEYVEFTDANELVASLKVTSHDLKRKLPEGSEVELTIAIDTSRLLRVVAYVPSLNQRISDAVRVPLRDQVIWEQLAQKVPEEVKDYFQDLRELATDAGSDPVVQEQLRVLEAKLMDLEFRVSFSAQHIYLGNPDEAKRIVLDSRIAHGLILRLRYRNGPTFTAMEEVELLKTVQAAVEFVERYADVIDKQALSALRREFDRISTGRDIRSLRRIAREFEELHSRVLVGQMWYWTDWFEFLKEPRQPFLDSKEALLLIATGDAAVAAADREKLSKAVRSLWRLQPGQAVDDEDKGRKSGLKNPIGMQV